MSELGITPSQAHYVLSRMVKDRTITRKDVVSCLSMMQSEIDELEKRLDALRSVKEGDEKPAPASRSRRRGKTAAAPEAKTKAKAKAKAKITPQQRASRKLQGVYMSMLRRIPKGKRTQYQNLAKEKDRQAAVDAMKAVLKI